MSHDLVEYRGKKFEIGRPVAYRFAQFIKIAKHLDYIDLVEHFCKVNFKHQNYLTLTGAEKEELMQIASTIVYEAVLELKYLS